MDHYPCGQNEEGGREDVCLQRRRLPGMVDDAERVLGPEEVFHPEVNHAAHGYDQGQNVKGPGLPTFHDPSTWSMASTRRTAWLAARAVSVAPAMGRMARCKLRSLFNPLPLYCAYHCEEARYSGGSRK